MTFVLVFVLYFQSIAYSENWNSVPEYLENQERTCPHGYDFDYPTGNCVYRYPASEENCTENFETGEMTCVRNDQDKDINKGSSSNTETDQSKSLCPSSYSEAREKCSESSVAPSVQAKMQQLAMFQNRGSVAQACRTAQEINSLMWSVNAQHGVSCDRAVKKCLRECRAGTSKYSHCQDLRQYVGQTQNQAIENAKAFAQSQACLVASEGSPGNDDLETSAVVTDSRQIPSTQVFLPAQIQQQGNPQGSTFNNSKALNLKNLKILESPYGYEGNKIVGSNAKYNSQKNDSTGFSKDLLGKQADNVANADKKTPDHPLAKDSTSFSNSGGTLVGINTAQQSSDSIYENNDHRSIKNVPSLEEQKKLYALQELEKSLQPKKPMTQQEATRKYLAQKYSGRENSFSTRMISSLDEIIGYEIDYYDESNNAYLSRPKWFVFLSGSLVVMFVLSILAIMYLGLIKPTKTNPK